MICVSVVVPVYKTQEKLLRACIESLMKQTLKEIEIILVDDGSPDNCGNVCDEYAEKDTRIIVIHKKNEGVSVARNVGIEMAKGKYISFVDGDDWIDADAFAVAYKRAEENGVDILQWSYIWHCEEQTVGNNHVFMKSGILDKGQKEELILKAIVDFHPSFSCNCGFAAGAPWAKLYRRDFLIEKNLTFAPGLARSQDRIFNLYAYSVADTIDYLDEPFSHYIANDTSAVVSYRPNIEKVYDKYLEKIEEFIKTRRPGNELFEEARAICQCYVLQQIFTQYLFNRKCDKPFSAKLKEVKRISKDSRYAEGIRDIDMVKASLTKKQYLGIKMLSISPFVAACGMEINRKTR